MKDPFTPASISADGQPPDSDMTEESKQRLRNRTDEMEQIKGTPVQERSAELSINQDQHLTLEMLSENGLQCPVCGGPAHECLEWTCHDIPIQEAMDLANRAYQDHLDNDPELKGTEYEDVAAEHRGWEGKGETVDRVHGDSDVLETENQQSTADGSQ